MPQRYHVVSTEGTASAPDSRDLARFLAKDGQFLLPMLDLIENAQGAIDDLIDVMGRATIEAVLLMSAAAVAGPKQQGKKAGRDIAYHGSQPGRVALRERQLRVDKPRLRRKAPKEGEAGEVEIPAYEAMRKDGRLADRMLEVLISGVSTRRYERVLPEMAETVGVSRSQVSRETIEAGERTLKELAERDFSGTDILVVWIDGLQLGAYHVICAVGADSAGNKHVLGLREGATENAEVAKGLLEDLVARGPEVVAAAAVRDRWLEGVAVGHRRRIRGRELRPEVPQPQGEERGRAPAQGSARAGPGDAAGGLEARRRGGDGAGRAVRLVAGVEVADGVGIAAGRAGGAVHDQPPGPAEQAAPLPGDDEHHRQRAFGAAGPGASA